MAMTAYLREVLEWLPLTLESPLRGAPASTLDFRNHAMGLLIVQ
jgi:hypothetical protein